MTATNGPDESPRVTLVGHRVKLRRPVVLGFVVVARAPPHAARRRRLRARSQLFQTSTHIYIHTLPGKNIVAAPWINKLIVAQIAGSDIVRATYKKLSLGVKNDVISY